MSFCLERDRYADVLPVYSSNLDTFLLQRVHYNIQLQKMYNDEQFGSISSRPSKTEGRELKQGGTGRSGETPVLIYVVSGVNA